MAETEIKINKVDTTIKEKLLEQAKKAGYRGLSPYLNAELAKLALNAQVNDLNNYLGKSLIEIVHKLNQLIEISNRNVEQSAAEKILLQQLLGIFDEGGDEDETDK